MGFCPITRECCSYSCEWWNDEAEKCSMYLIGEAMNDIHLIADDYEFGIKVQVTDCDATVKMYEENN